MLLRTLNDAGLLIERVPPAFFRHEHYADLKDYLLAVREAWGSDAAWDLLRKLRGDEGPTVYSGYMEDNVPDAVYAPQLLLWMPEPDFLTCVEIGYRMASDARNAGTLAAAINRACEARGIPYRFEGFLSAGHFVWTGDAILRERVVQPALSALDDPRLAGGPRSEFNAARDELRQGTPGALKQAVAEACNAIESGLKVLLQANAQSLPARQNLEHLLNACVDAGLIPPDAREIVAAPGRFGNRRGRHGAGAVAHNVTAEEAETVVAAAAVAVTFIAKRLP